MERTENPALCLSCGEREPLTAYHLHCRLCITTAVAELRGDHQADDLFQQEPTPTDFGMDAARALVRAGKLSPASAAVFVNGYRRGFEHGRERERTTGG